MGTRESLNGRKIFARHFPARLDFPSSPLSAPGSLRMGFVQTGATTPNIVAPTMLVVVACVLAVVCKRMQQLPTSLGHAVYRNERAWPNNVGRAVQTDPTLLRYASAITEQKKYWELLAEKFDRFQTLCNNTQRHPTTCNRVCKRTQHITSNNDIGSCWPTMLRPFARGLRSCDFNSKSHP